MLFLIIPAIIIISICLFLQHTKFGRRPSGGRLERIVKSPNYKNGQFQNLSHTPDLAEGATYFKVFSKFFFGKSKRSRPAKALPSKKTDLHNLGPEENIVVWFGHSSYFMQTDGRKILVDPVFSGHASPVTFTTKAFAGSDAYSAEDMPEIDYLIITHDHWDHLDYETVLNLKPKVKQVITSLGTGEHLEYWGYDTAIIEERDWNETIALGYGFVINTLPARHFSGRGLKRNRSMWMSFVLTTPSFKIYIGGDTGYDSHFKTIGDTYGPFDLAILECGQYNEYWKYIHMMPHEVVQAAIGLKAKKLMPVHWGKFALALHDWDEPIIKVTAAFKEQGMPIMTPMIGEKAGLKDSIIYPEWWRGLE